MWRTASVKTARRLGIVIAVFSVSTFAPVTGHAQTSEGVVPITAEPNHRIRFDNGNVRIYEVLLPKGKATMWHEHRADSFSVVFKTSEAIEEPKDGKPGSYITPAGYVGFAADSKKPYVHRVIAKSDTPFHVVDIELLSGAPAGPENASRRPNPPFKVKLENARGRAYRFVLNPGESTEPFTRPANSGMFAISAGRISEHVEGKTARLWDFDPANFRWFDSTERLSVKNEGMTPIDLVEIEIY